MRDHILSTGNGQGRIHFFDIRKCKWLIDNNNNNNNNNTSSMPLFLQCSQGSLRIGEALRSIVSTPAIYSHSWNPSQTKLLVAGGPLQCGLMGAYVGIWE
eukprot:TRINITY_DN23978_c0_g1_i4.p4 TRINITY_DN23978_c0_g1~~TRINITY_DN23978_c0_g1_i4.p4  ORF type:complete len:100 (-),score=7.50 TRINITY_DN23978_c0_g1_i4:82-381(-)